ncbi:MAG: cupin domain-containing protein [Geodermatophilaceae bacterium]|nr:cupin domain-containing protein [Geodermatophilaceae bacterium]
MQAIEAGRFNCPVGLPNRYDEHLCVPALSVGTYSIPAGGKDDQLPHFEDEVYMVTAGRAMFRGGSGDPVAVGPGSVLFVGAGEEHRFLDIEQDLSMVVVFAPPYGSTAPS